MYTFLLLFVRFSTRPCRELACQGSIVNPVELIVRFSVKSKPRTPFLHCFLVHNQVKYEVILLGRSDDGQVCPVSLINRASIAPHPGWGVQHEVTRTSIKNPALRTISSIASRRVILDKEISLKILNRRLKFDN